MTDAPKSTVSVIDQDTEWTAEIPVNKSVTGSDNARRIYLNALEQAIEVCYEQEREFLASDQIDDQKVGSLACRRCARIIRLLMEDYND